MRNARPISYRWRGVLGGPIYSAGVVAQAVMAPRQNTMIMASKTEYSTAVGPPSAVMNVTPFARIDVSQTLA
jgi:hypothetical protein